jgi:ABC-type sulfate transport system substrate-binding protein
MKLSKFTTTFTALSLALATATAAVVAKVTLLIMSYDPTRVLCLEFNKSFAV